MKAGFVTTPETGADPLRDLVRGQQAGRFDDPSLAMPPLRLDRVEPRTLRRQAGRRRFAPPSFLLDRPIVRP